MKTSELVELKPCPFCGGRAAFEGSEGRGYNAACQYCDARGGWGDYGYQAAAAWNTRSAIPDGIKLATPWVEGACDNDAEAEANAEFIVHACNAHCELLNIVRDVVHLGRLPNGRTRSRYITIPLDVWRRALVASGIEAATADETRSGSAEGESPARRETPSQSLSQPHPIPLEQRDGSGGSA